MNSIRNCSNLRWNTFISVLIARESFCWRDPCGTPCWTCPAELPRVCWPELRTADSRPAGLSERLATLAGGPWPRLAVPAFAALAAVAVWLQVSAPAPEEPQIAVEEEYTQEELVVAIQDLNTTIQTLNEITESMRVRLGDRMVSLPVLSLPAISVDRTNGGAAAPSRTTRSEPAVNLSKASVRS